MGNPRDTGNINRQILITLISRLLELTLELCCNLIIPNYSSILVTIEQPKSESFGATSGSILSGWLSDWVKLVTIEWPGHGKFITNHFFPISGTRQSLALLIYQLPSYIQSAPAPEMRFTDNNVYGYSVPWTLSKAQNNAPHLEARKTNNFVREDMGNEWQGNYLYVMLWNPWVSGSKSIRVQVYRHSRWGFGRWWLIDNGR